MEIIFIFDFDGTLTTTETLPYIADHYSQYKEEILDLTTKTINGNIPFEEGFEARVKLLKNLSVDKIKNLMSNISVHSKLMSFINENPEKTCIATGNLDAWIDQALDKFHCRKCTSTAEVTSSGEVLGVNTILNKYELVRQFKKEGKIIVFAGDGNNDAMAMEEADIAIAAGLIHQPANSVFEVSDYVVYSENALLRLLIQINSFYSNLNLNKSYAVLLCAGTGSRLGLSVTKALLKINELTLIGYHLTRLTADFDLVFVVVGFQSQDVILNSKFYGENIVYVLNRSYAIKGPGHSLYLATKYIDNKILVFDCDLVISKNSYYDCLRMNFEFIGCADKKSSSPVTVRLSDNKVIAFEKTLIYSRNTSTDRSLLEWTGPLKIHTSKVKDTGGQVFELLESLLPIDLLRVDAFDIDTMSEYIYAQKVFKEYQ